MPHASRRFAKVKSHKTLVRRKKGKVKYMKILFLGSSHGVPSAERFCSCTLVEVGDCFYLIDAGAPVIDLILRYGRAPENLRAVFTTHGHGDHIDGLLSLTDLSNWYFKKMSYDVYVTEDDVAENIVRCAETVCRLPLDTERIRYHITSPDTVYDDGTIRVSFFPTKHCLPHRSYSILVEAEGKRVLFSGDLSQNLERKDFPKVALETDTNLIICEMAHFTPEHISPYLGEIRTGHLCFNHVYPLDKLEWIKEIGVTGIYPYKITIAADGDCIEL